MSLSVCIIARDEAEGIARALRSVKAIADEIIVVDTGSADATPAIAAREGAVVSHLKWTDDFAAARNASFALAKSDWILWIDADEELPAESVSELRACMDRPDAMGFCFLRQDLDDKDRPDAYTEMWTLRLFRRHPRLHMSGRIHERFDPPLEELAVAENKIVVRSSVRLRHFGYLQARRIPKWKRNSRLLAMQLEQNPRHLHSLIEYGRTLLDLGDARGHEFLARAAVQIAAARDAAHPPDLMAPIFLEYLFVCPESPAAKIVPGQLRREMCRRWYPNTPPLLWRLAQEDFAAGEFESCAAILEHLIELCAAGNYDHTMSFSPQIMGDRPLVNLGVCYVRMAELDKAENCFRRLLSSDECGKEAAQNLKVVDEIRRAYPS